LGEYLEKKTVLSVVFGASLGLHWLLSVISWFLAVSLAVGIPLLTILWVWPIVLLAVRLPILVLGFGVREVLLLELLGTMGLSAESAVSLGLLSGAFEVLVISLGGLLVLGGTALKEPLSSRISEASGGPTGTVERIET
jgi:uncharacterized membrane protein YbhN (UPF0104 family)